MRIILVVLAIVLLAPPAPAAERFQFDRIRTVKDMQEFIEKNLPLGTTRAEVQKVFVLQGRGSLRNHPSQKGVEKYLYDINLCHYYVFRWNISADYDEQEKLKQAYVNGLPVFLAGAPGRVLDINAAGTRGNTKLARMWREWPQADKGAKRVSYMMVDLDGDMNTIDDQSLVGVGASQADPADLGYLVAYNDIEPWRSIFDRDLADDVYDYKGDCRAADAKYVRKSLTEPQHSILK